MKKLMMTFSALVCLSIGLTSCGHTGCPMQITKEIQFDKELKTDDFCAMVEIPNSLN